MEKKISRPKKAQEAKKPPIKILRPKQPKKTQKQVTVPMTETISLSNLKAPKGAHKHKKLLGRGSSSGHGKTSTRGSKGQTSRAGRHFYLGFEGGQSPLIRRIPKRGFTNRFKKEYQVINLSDLNRIKESAVTLDVLEKNGLIKNKQKLVKVLGDGEIKNPLSIQAHAFSKRAAEEIKKAGGKTEIINA
jgi:large subunit ribosomal protein L15